MYMVNALVMAMEALRVRVMVAGKESTVMKVI